jgi:hypothetical protein
MTLDEETKIPGEVNNGMNTAAVGLTFCWYFTFRSNFLLIFYFNAFRGFPCSTQKLPSAGGWSIFVNMFTFHLSFHIVSVLSPRTLVITSPYFNLSFFPKFLSISFQFGPCQYHSNLWPSYVYHQISQEGEKIVHVEIVSQIFNPCSTDTVLSVAVIATAACFPSLPEYKDTLYVYPLKSYTL